MHRRSTGAWRLIGPTMALAAAFILATGCPKTPPQELLQLRELSVSPELAKAGTSLTIDLMASRRASVDPVVTVAGEAATVVGNSTTADGSTRYVYAYVVKGSEDEGEAPVVAIAEPGGAESRLETTVVFDFTPPSVTNLRGPDDPTKETNATFTFGCSEEGCEFVCGLSGRDAGVVAPKAECESGQDYTGLGEDIYTFEVTATDPAGNEGVAAVWSWVVTSDVVDPGIDRRAGVYVTSGGGTMTSPAHTMRIFVGGPAPQGSATGSGHDARLGPGAE